MPKHLVVKKSRSHLPPRPPLVIGSEPRPELLRGSVRPSGVGSRSYLYLLGALLVVLVACSASRAQTSTATGPSGLSGPDTTTTGSTGLPVCCRVTTVLRRYAPARPGITIQAKLVTLASLTRFDPDLTQCEFRACSPGDYVWLVLEQGPPGSFQHSEPSGVVESPQADAWTLFPVDAVTGAGSGDGEIGALGQLPDSARRSSAIWTVDGQPPANRASGACVFHLWTSEQSEAVQMTICRRAAGTGGPGGKVPGSTTRLGVHSDSTRQDETHGGDACGARGRTVRDPSAPEQRHRRHQRSPLYCGGGRAGQVRPPRLRLGHGGRPDGRRRRSGRSGRSRPPVRARRPGPRTSTGTGRVGPNPGGRAGRRTSSQPAPCRAAPVSRDRHRPTSDRPGRRPLGGPRFADPDAAAVPPPPGPASRAARNCSSLAGRDGARRGGALPAGPGRHPAASPVVGSSFPVPDRRPARRSWPPLGPRRRR